MTRFADTLSRLPSGKWARLAALVFALLAALVLGLVFFPWDAMRGPLNRYISEQMGRPFEITRRLEVRLGTTVRVLADGIEIGNPTWARDPYLLKAELAQIDIRLWPLFLGRLVLPQVSLQSPQLGLQLEADGRRTWALGKDTSDEGSVPGIGSLLVDQGVLNYLAPGQGADISADFALSAEAGTALPLSYQARGKWKGEAFTATGRAGGVLQFGADTTAAFPLEISATAGRTRFKASGTITDLARMAAINAQVQLEGQSLEDLYKLVGVVLPGTPPYKLQGQLDKQGLVWSIRQLKGMLGKSDLAGDLAYDRSGALPRLTGKVQSKLLDFEDLGPMIGLPSGNAAPGMQPAQTKAQPAPQPGGRVLPATKLDFARLKAMNADVSYSAADIRHVQALPLDSASVRIKLDQGLLELDPLRLGVAGGQLSGRLAINSASAPPTIDARLRARAVELNQLFPTIASTQSSLGRISGQIELQGRGDSTAQVLATSSGNVSFLMGRGEISNILLEFMGLDGGEVIKFLVRGDRNVQLRCAAASFGVQQGLMSSQAIVLDTVDTVIRGQGQVSLADETLDLVLEPEPKDGSILSFRSPLKIGGTFGAPTAGPDKGALAGRAGLALALAVINPLLALAATIETGPGQDANCSQVLKQAAAARAPAVK